MNGGDNDFGGLTCGTIIGAQVETPFPRLDPGQHQRPAALGASGRRLWTNLKSWGSMVGTGNANSDGKASHSATRHEKAAAGLSQRRLRAFQRRDTRYTPIRGRLRYQ